VQQLRALREQIPEFVVLPRGDTATLSRAASVDGAFIQASINAVGASDALRMAIGKTAEELRQETELVARWSAVVDEIDALRSGASAAATVRRHRIGLTALQTYKMSEQLVRKKEHAHLLPHVEVMRRRAKFTKRRGSQPQPGGESGPQPEPLAPMKQP
jgi:hypothetical protein